MKHGGVISLCALAAVAGHLALLLAAGEAGSPAVAPGGRQAVHASLRAMAVHTVPASAEHGVAQPATPPLSDRQRPPDLVTPRATATAPRLEGPWPTFEIPDSPMPAGGVRLRLFAEVGADGRAIAIASAALPAEAGSGFQDLSERALSGAVFAPAATGHGFCLELRFTPDEAAPRLAWVPDGADDAAGCLTRTWQARTRTLPVPPPS